MKCEPGTMKFGNFCGKNVLYTLLSEKIKMLFSELTPQFIQPWQQWWADIGEQKDQWWAATRSRNSAEREREQSVARRQWSETHGWAAFVCSWLQWQIEQHILMQGYIFRPDVLFLTTHMTQILVSQPPHFSSALFWWLLWKVPQKSQTES